MGRDTVRTRVTAKQIIQIVADNVDLDVDKILTKNRKRENVDARKLMAHFLEENTTLTAGAIGAMIKTGKHDSIYYYRRVLPELLAYNKKINNQFQNISHDIDVANGVAYAKEKSIIPSISGEDFVSSVLDVIDWNHRGTTRDNLMRLWYRKFLNNK